MLKTLDEKRKQSLINAAMKEFVKRGYDRASTNEIAKNAKISKALMFHYAESKETLFLFLIEYCQNEMTHQFSKKMDFKEHDLLQRLHHSYLLQLELLKKNPWMLDFSKLSPTTKSTRINKKLIEIDNKETPFCSETLFDSVDETLVTKKISVAKSKELILWSNLGFIDQIIKDIQSFEVDNIHYDEIVRKMDDYFAHLRLIFYIQ